MLMSKRKTYLKFWPYLLITILIVAVYFPTFSGEFILDDRPLIENNPYVKKFHSLVFYLFQEDGITDESDSGGYHTGYYRPLINLSYSIDYRVWGLCAPGFRTTNLLLHLFCCFLLFHFLSFLTGDRLAALWATLLFALHPVNTEAVSWIGSRDNILVAFFSIASLFFYIKGWEGGSRLNRIASILMFALAISSKEMGLMLLPLFFLYQRFCFQTKQNVREEMLSYLPFIIVLAAYFLLRKAVTSSFSSPLQIVDLWKSLCFAPYLILWNLKLIFLPYGLHNFVVDYPTTGLNWQAISGFCYIAFLGVFIWILRKNRLMIFAVLSFHVLIFPTLNIIPTSAISLVSLRWIYFPMAFLAIMFAQVIRGGLRRNGFVAIGVFSVILVYFGSYSYILNANLWKNERNLFTQEVLNFGNHYYAGGLAENLFERQKYQYAEKYFQIAINYSPLEAMNYLNYAALLIDTGRPDVALTYLKKAKKIQLKTAETGQWCNNMGAAYFHLGKHDKAIEYFLEAASQCPNKIQFHTNLGAAYTTKGDYERAVSVLEKALEIAPDSVPLHKNVALNYIHMNRRKDALRVLQEIPKEERAKHGVQELFEKVQRDFLRLDRNPGAR